MKKIFWVMVVTLFSASIVMAAPFLMCDDPPEGERVTSYLVSLNGGDEIETPAPLYYDLAGIEDGTHIIDVKAKNIWGSGSPAAPFPFTKTVPSEVMGISISITSPSSGDPS